MWLTYLYCVTAFSLTILYISATVGLDNLVFAMYKLEYTPFVVSIDPPDRAAGALGFALPALLIWGLHWRWLLAERLSFDPAQLQFYQFYSLIVAGILIFNTLMQAGTAASGLFKTFAATALPETGAAGLGAFLSLLLSVGLWLSHLLLARPWAHKVATA